MKIHSLLVPVDDLGSAVEFLTGNLGCVVKIRDGDRYCALDAGGQMLALVSGEERVVDTISLVVRVDDINAAVASIIEGGGQLLSPPHEGPHEVRAVVTGAGGVPMVLSAKRPSAG
ncbi:VOC family protein [Paraburkholderia acidicola]|uniref:VOC family protein n=1 Tax=Paraburkholderia acidicola TaxID=1912599 RepID=A0ABV1LYH0_9BURK